MQELEKIQGSIAKANEQFEKEGSECLNDLVQLRAEIKALERKKAIELQINADLKAENIDLSSAIKVARDEITRLDTTETEATERISALTSKETKLTESTGDLTLEIEAKTEALTNLDAEFVATEEKHNRNIGILTSKLQDLSEQIMQNRADDEQVRDNLAKWERSLGEKDKNLRTREARVSEQEKSIARNYNLLNL